MFYYPVIVCLSVSNFMYKNYWSKFNRDESVDKEELTKFWKSSASASISRNF